MRGGGVRRRGGGVRMRVYQRVRYYSLYKDCYGRLACETASNL